MKRSVSCFVDHAPGGCQLYDLVFIAVLVYSAMCPANGFFFVGIFYLGVNFLVRDGGQGCIYLMIYDIIGTNIAVCIDFTACKTLNALKVFTMLC